jgi:hypothetical protein
MIQQNSPALLFDCEQKFPTMGSSTAQAAFDSELSHSF